MLSSLLGAGGMNALTSAIGSYAGMSSGKSETLLGLLGPIVMGAIGQQQHRTGLDAGGIASVLASQKDQIAAAMPSGLTGQLRDSGFLDTLDGAFRRGAEAPSGFARKSHDKSQDMTRDISDLDDEASAAASRQAAAASSPGSASWPYWLGAIAILAALGWYFLAERDGMEMAEQTPGRAPAETVGRAAPGQSMPERDGATPAAGAVGHGKPGCADHAGTESALRSGARDPGRCGCRQAGDRHDAKQARHHVARLIAGERSGLCLVRPAIWQRPGETAAPVPP
jgi:hypothetical protein